MFDEQATALRQLAQPLGILQACDQIVKQLNDKEATAQFPAAPLRPVVPGPSLADRLQICPEELAWVNLSPFTDADATAMAALQGDDAFKKAMEGLIAQIKADGGKTCVLVQKLDAPPRYPDGEELPEVLKAQLDLAGGHVSWKGRVGNNAQLMALRQLAADPHYDLHFREAVQSILDELENWQVSGEAIDVVKRPVEPDHQPETTNKEGLRDRLLIGRVLLRVDGLMTSEEYQKLLSSYGGDKTADGLAIFRLYDASLKRGLRGKELKIMTRRGAAAPTPAEPISIKKL
jgi:hypothetical protein